MEVINGHDCKMKLENKAYAIYFDLPTQNDSQECWKEVEQDFANAIETNANNIYTRHVKKLKEKNTRI